MKPQVFRGFICQPKKKFLAISLLGRSLFFTPAVVELKVNKEVLRLVYLLPFRLVDLIFAKVGVWSSVVPLRPRRTFSWDPLRPHSVRLLSRPLSDVSVSKRSRTPIMTVVGTWICARFQGPRRSLNSGADPRVRRVHSPLEKSGWSTPSLPSDTGVSRYRYFDLRLDWSTGTGYVRVLWVPYGVVLVSRLTFRG